MMITKTIKNFDISQICDSGQCFRMTKKDDHIYTVIALDRYLEIRQTGSTCEFYCEEAEFEEFWSIYFDLDTDYASYIEKVDVNDKYLNEAVCFGTGLRILKQDLWEMIVSFLISQQNHIARIRRCIGNICGRYGEEKVSASGEVYRAFPKPEALAHLEENALMECNLGYRSKYVVRAAKSVASGETDLEKLRTMPYKSAKEELLKFFGVGEKVADCICLFALHHLQAFPVDTHIRQALSSNYKGGFPNGRYEGFEGVIQQYIFYYELCGMAGKGVTGKE